MLIQVLPELEKRFNIQFKLFLVYESVPGVTIDPKLMRAWAIKDANYIADQYQLKKITQQPTQESLFTGLLCSIKTVSFLDVSFPLQKEPFRNTNIQQILCIKGPAFWGQKRPCQAHSRDEHIISVEKTFSEKGPDPTLK